MKGSKDYILLYLKGIGMGGADVVPGVSGGTIAFITGIYEELINSIKSLDLNAFKLLFSLRLNEFWKHINGPFLITLFLGIVTSILSLAKLITYLLEHFPIQLWSFFFGLIVISALSVGSQIKNKNFVSGLFGVAGIVIAYLITSATPATTPDALWFIFLSGMVAICAMILPGISGSFILLIFGKYQYVLESLKDVNVAVIVVFVAGCVVGILSFSRVVSWFLQRHHDSTVAVLAGFMVGSLYKIWPWKNTLSYRVNSAGEQVPFLQDNVLPTEYLELTGNEPLLLYAVLFMAFGFFIVVILEKIALSVRKPR
ncbi:MAG: DUF368 domain-containing protein [Cyclobacteriaceae bacterium]